MMTEFFDALNAARLSHSIESRPGLTVVTVEGCVVVNVWHDQGGRWWWGLAPALNAAVFKLGPDKEEKS